MATATQSQLQRDIDRFRAQLLRMELRATGKLTAAYADVLTALDARIVAVSRMVAEAQASGIVVNEAWLFQQERYQELRRQVLVSLDRYAQQTQAIATASQRAAVQMSLAQASSMLAPVSGGSGGALAELVSGWAQLPNDSIIRMVGALQQGTPLTRSLDRYGPDAVERITETLVRGLALGQGADETARQLRSSVNITRASAESLVRTSTMHASRGAMIAAYQESGVVEQWRWIAAKSERTCASCLSKHNKTFDLDVPMTSHRSCRCVAVAVLPGEADDNGEETGEQWLKKQPVDVQEKCLGRQGAADFRAGNVRLDDFSKEVIDPVYGRVSIDGGIGHARQVATKAGRAPKEWATVESKTAKAVGQGEPEAVIAKSPDVPAFEVPAEPPAWKPSMTKAEANAWAKDSVDQRVYGHATGAEGLTGIPKHGFDLDRKQTGRMFGDGVYMTDDLSVLRHYEGLYGGNGGTLKLRVNTRTMIEADGRIIGQRGGSFDGYSMIRYSDHPNAAAIEDIRSAVTKEKYALYAEVRKIADYQDLHFDAPVSMEHRKAEILKQLNQPKFTDSDAWEVTEWARINGVDGIRIFNSGRDQTVIFNPENVVVIVE